MSNLGHVLALKDLPFIASTDITGSVAGCRREVCLPKVTQQDHPPALDLLLTVRHLHTWQPSEAWPGTVNRDHLACLHPAMCVS